MQDNLIDSIVSWWSHFTFAYPWLLPLLLIIPFIIYWELSRNKKQYASYKVSSLQFMRPVYTWKLRFRAFPFILRCMALTILILALARPQGKFSEEMTSGDGIDIILCFDISGSMTSQDFKPDRLEAAKEIATDFIGNRSGDRIGVVIFSSQSFTLCPLTTDHNAVLSQIKGIQNGYLIEDGTAIGSGLATSVDRLKDSKAKTKIVILMTDGVDFGGIIPPDIAEKLAKLYGIKVYCIGIGSNQVMDSDPSGIRSGKVLPAKFDFNENLLKQISSETGGQYFSAVDKDGLSKCYETINQLEKSKIEINSYNHYTEQFLPLLLVGLSLIIVEILLRLTILKKFP